MKNNKMVSKLKGVNNKIKTKTEDTLVAVVVIGIMTTFSGVKRTK